MLKTKHISYVALSLIIISFILFMLFKKYYYYFNFFTKGDYARMTDEYEEPYIINNVITEKKRYILLLNLHHILMKVVF